MTFGFGAQAENRVTVEIAGDADRLRREVTAAEKLTRGFARNASDDLKLVKSAAVGVATGIGGIAAAVGAIAVKGGVDRLMGLERAHRQLDQLGVSTGDAKRLTDSLLESLLGTPFALDKGAASLAGFVASGRDLDDIPRLIQQVTDAAAFGNTTLDEADFIWQRIQTTGRATNKELRMLAERNIPVYTQLAGAFETTGAAVFDMAASGELSADKFFDGWERAAQGTEEGTVRIAGAAKAMGETTDGAWRNMRTAMSRFGATLLEDVFPVAKQIFSNIGEGFDRMGEVWKRRVGDITDTEGWASLEGFIERIPDLMADAAEGIFDAWEATKTFRDVAGTVFKGFAELLSNRVVLAIGAVTIALYALYAHPVLAGLAAVGGLIGTIAKNAETGEGNVAFLADELQRLSQTDAEAALRDWLTPGNLRMLEDMGISIFEMARLLREGKAGTEEWNQVMGPFLDTTRSWSERNEELTGEQRDLAAAIEGATAAQTAQREETGRSIPVVDEATRKQREQEETARRLFDINTNLPEAISATTGATSDLATGLGELTEAELAEIEAKQKQIEETQKLAAEFKTAMEDMVGVSASSWDQITGDVEDFLTGFEEVPEKADITMAEFETNFNERAERMKTFWNTIHQLMAIEGTEALVNELIAQGPSAVGVAQEYLADPIKAQTESAFIKGSEEGIANLIALITGTQLPALSIPVQLPTFRYTDPSPNGGTATPVKSGSRIFSQHGGIAQSRSGGVDITAAEAGADEAIIPLNDEGARFMAQMFAQLWERLGPAAGSGPATGGSGLRPIHVEVHGHVLTEHELLEFVVQGLHDQRLLGNL